MLKRLFFIGFILLMFSFPASFIYAQADAELIAYSGGDLWSWSVNGNTEQLTFWGYNGGPILSPDGTKIAFLSFDGKTGEKIQSGELYTDFGALPSNIWVMDTATHEFQWINDQTGAGEGGILRSYPTWSPDSKRLAWSELVSFDIGAKLMVYDFPTNKISILNGAFNMGYQDAGIWMPPVQWGGGGISRILFSYADNFDETKNILEIYHPDTGELNSIDLAFLGIDLTSFLAHVWIKKDGKDLIALQNSNRWGLIDPATNSFTPLKSPPALQLKDGNSVQLIPVYNESDYSIDWYVNDNGAVDDLGFNSYSIEFGNIPTISPEGRSVAWTDGGLVFVRQLGASLNGAVIYGDSDKQYDTPDPISAVWAPTEWVIGDTAIIIQVRPTAVPQATIAPTAIPQASNNNNNSFPASNCKLPQKLFPGGYGILAPGDNNNVRQSYSKNSQKFGEIYPGEVVYIEAGPVCNDGINWYLVQNEFVYGWTAEGFNGQYWLLPHLN